MGMTLNLIRINQHELDSFLNDPSLLEDFLDNDDENANQINIDKSWGGILFLLTGGTYNDSHPSNRIFFSCNFIDEEQDLGYGPAHYLTKDEVSIYAKELSAINLEDLKNNFDPLKMDAIGVYPGNWERDGEEERTYLIEYFEELRSFYLAAAQKEQAILTFIG